MKTPRLLAATALASALSLSACATVEAPPVAAAPAPAPAEDTSLTALVDEISIPHEVFTLDNGLTTIVHTDRKSPLVGVTVYYRVGSKSEPRGRTGFAHLFEHLMFGGSENVPNFDIPLEAAGSTPTNGSTWYDRTNYVETVPTGALDLALFMESDRMGYLLGAVSQEKLDNQRMVVQNEKRQGDNQPFGLVDYKVTEGLFPVGHPYRHSTIGSMADLDAASLADVRSWFTDNYGPNNVVIALAGDIDVPTARAAVERWFGDIPAGPAVTLREADPVTLAAPVREEMADQVPNTRILKAWSGPGLNSPDAEALDIGMSILGGLATSRLDNALVRGNEVATRVSAYAGLYEQVSTLETFIDVKPGGDTAEAERLFQAELDRLLRDGPTADEVQRAATQAIAGQIGSLQRVGGFGGKGMILAEGLLYSGDASHYRKSLERTAALTPAEVQAAMQRWLGRPSYTLTVVPGERTEDGALLGGWGDEATTPAPEPDAKAPVEVTRTGPPRTAPEVAPVGDLTFPTVETAELSNGLDVRLARRTVVPQVSMALTFDGGLAADAPNRSGTQSLMMEMLDQGTTTRTVEEIASEAETLGASISTGVSSDSSTVSMTALTARLAPSLDLMADIVRNAAFNAPDFSRVQSQRLAEIEQTRSNPGGLATLAFYPAIYGDAHPYSTIGQGSADYVQSLTPATLKAEHDRWLRPDNATLTVVGDITMAELVPMLEASFGSWQAPATAAPQPDISAPIPAPKSRLIVVDRPNSPSSTLYIGRVTPLSTTTPETLDLANEVLGNGFLSRLNMDLRETKGWTYGVRSGFSVRKGREPFIVSTQVQADRTADSIRAIVDQMKAFPSAKPVDEVELQRVTEGNVRNLPNRYETNAQVLGALLSNQAQGLPDDYQTQLPAIYRAIGADQLNAAAAQYLTPDNLTVVIVGDKDAIADQIATLDMQPEYIDPSEL